MAQKSDAGLPGSPTIEQLLAAQLAILVADREERITGAEAKKTELVLHEAGLVPLDIARLVGKKVDAVRKTIQRVK